MGSYDFSEARTFARQGRWTPIDRTLIFWTEQGGDHAGVPVAFLHGIPGWSWLWRDVIREVGLEHRSIALDLPGFGLSDKSPRHSFRVSALAETVEHFLHEVCGPDQAVNLVVHDFGALVGAEMIRRRPGQYPRIVITNTSLRADGWVGGGPLRVLSVPYLGDLSMALARPWMLRLAMYPFVADPQARTPERVAGYWYPFEAGFGASLARLYREKVFEHQEFDYWREALGKYTGESLLIWGSRDPSFTLAEAEDLLTLLPGAEVQVFENASHFVPEERPQALGRQVRAFLSGRKD